MGLGDTSKIDIVEFNEVNEKKLKKHSKEPILSIVSVVVFFLSTIYCIGFAQYKIYTNSQKIKSLQSDIKHNEIAIDYLMDEVSKLKVFTDKPIKDYSVKELFTIDMVKEFDATYRQELDDDPDIGEYILLDAKDISEGFLKHRADSKNQPVLIERVFGVVTNNKLDGKVIDAGTNDYYISYAGVKGAQKGDLVVSYIMYEKNNYPDDIAVREDFVING